MNETRPLMHTAKGLLVAFTVGLLGIGLRPALLHAAGPDGLGTGVTWHIEGDLAYAEMTDVFLDTITVTGDIVTLRLRPSGPGPDGLTMTYADLIGRIRARRPGLPILTYTHILQIKKPSLMIGQQWLNGLVDHPEWVLYSVTVDGKTSTYPDITIPACRLWIATSVVSGWNATNTDGIFADVSSRRPTLPPAIIESKGGDAFLDQYASAYDLLWTDLKMRMKAVRANALLALNGVWTDSPYTTWEFQAAAMGSNANAAMIEFLGGRPSDMTAGYVPTWDQHVAPYWSVVETYPHVHWLVNGRHSWDPDNFPHPLVPWGRYLYAAYLMAAHGNTSFKYHSSFRVPNAVDMGEAGGDYLLPDLARSLGEPSGPRAAVGAQGWKRTFLGGFAALNRHDAAAPVTVPLPPGSFKDIDNNIYTGSVALAPAQGVILFDATPPAVSLTAPAAGNVTGLVNITATATDNLRVGSVVFYVDGVAVGTDTAAPYAHAWDTTTLPNRAYVLTARAYDRAGNSALSNPVSVTAANYQALFVSQTVPTALAPGESRSVTVVMQNSGVAPWTPEALIKLGSQPAGDATWGLARVTLGAGEVINPGQSKSFVFKITAPMTAGVYPFEWRMLREGVQWFGAATPVRQVNVNWTRTPVNASFLGGQMGLSSHYVAGNTSVLPGFASLFDVAKVAQQTAQSGAKRFLFLLHHQTKMMMAPNAAYDALMGNSLYTADRDVPLAFAEELDKYGVKLMLYINLRFDLASGCPPEVRDALAGTSPLRPNDVLVNNLVEIYREYSLRYGARVSGWWVDGVQRGSEWGLSPDRERYFGMLADAFRAGNPNAVVAFNPGIEIARYSNHADYTAGEQGDIEALPAAPLLDGVQWHNWLYLGAGWGQDGTRYDDPAKAAHLKDYVAQVRAAGGGILFDIGTASITHRGSIDPVQVEQLRYVTGTPDITLPTVAVTYPSAGAAVSGVVNVAASATDNVGVSSVRFLVNGVVQSTDTAAPYSYAWDTRTLPYGSYNLRARAYDAAGNTTLSPVVAVTVNISPTPDVTPPAVSFTAPGVGDALAGVVPVAVNASDDRGLDRVVFFVDGVAVSTDTAAPYGFSWDTRPLAAGPHLLAAWAYDASANSARSDLSVVLAPQDKPTAYPNPYRGDPAGMSFSGLAPGSPLAIYTLNGRSVAELASDASGRAHWPGTDNGAPAASGVYFVSAQGPSGRKVFKIMVVR